MAGTQVEGRMKDIVQRPEFQMARSQRRTQISVEAEMKIITAQLQQYRPHGGFGMAIVKQGEFIKADDALKLFSDALTVAYQKLYEMEEAER